jgi:hypothetical protein
MRLREQIAAMSAALFIALTAISTISAVLESTTRTAAAVTVIHGVRG